MAFKESDNDLMMRRLKKLNAPGLRPSPPPPQQVGKTPLELSENSWNFINYPAAPPPLQCTLAAGFPYFRARGCQGISSSASPLSSPARRYTLGVHQNKPLCVSRICLAPCSAPPALQ